MIVENLLNLIFPPVCGFCGNFSSDFLCNACRENLLKKSVCRVKEYKNNSFYFSDHFYLFNYEAEVRNKIIQYKFQDRSYLYKSFARLFIESPVFAQFIKNYSCIIPVPIHKKRLKSRGYNQSELIAHEISLYFNIPLYKSVLIKNKNIVAQSTLDKLHRELNIRGAFSINSNYSLAGNADSLQKIAIFDDIFTTGATANECAKILSNEFSPTKIRNYYYCKRLINKGTF